MKKLLSVILFLFIFLLSINNVSATQIDIIYPNENITTDIYYSTGNNMNYTQNNTLNTTNDVTYILIKNQYELVDIISNPTKILDYTFVLLYIIIFIGIISMFIYISIRVVKRI